MSLPRCRRLLAPLTAAVVAACASVPVNPATEEAAVRARSAEWNRAVTERNLEAVVALHAPDAIVMMPNMARATGHAGVRQTWQGAFGMGNMVLNWQPTRITVAGSGDLATEVGTYTMSFDTPQGRVNDAGGYITVWRKAGGTWLVESDIVTSSQPLPPPAPAPRM